MSKKVLIEKAELDRLQQRQLRDYTPELHSMSNIQNEMNAVLRNRKLSATQKLHFLNSYSTRFDKLRK